MTRPHPKPVRREPREIRLGSVDQAAAMLTVNPVTIRRMVDRGDITAYRVGRLIKVDLDELLEFTRMPTVRDAS